MRGGLAIVLTGVAATSGAEAAIGCIVPGDAALRASSRATADGYQAYQKWIANADTQKILPELGRTVNATFGEMDKHDPARQLAHGYIGTAPNHETQEYVIVVDPAAADPAAVQRTMTAAADRGHAQAGGGPCECRRAATRSRRCSPRIPRSGPGAGTRRRGPWSSDRAWTRTTRRSTSRSGARTRRWPRPWPPPSPAW
jgi:hypothetical protein